MNKNQQDNSSCFVISPSSKEGDLFFIWIVAFSLLINSVVAQNNTEFWKFQFKLNDTTKLIIDAKILHIKNNQFVYFPAYNNMHSEAKINFNSDSAVFSLGLYQNKFVTKKESIDKLSGQWIKYSGNKSYILPLTASKLNLSQIKQRQEDIQLMNNFSERWKIKTHSINNTDEALGIFQKYSFKNNYVRIKGSIATKSGDLGNLDGEIKNDSLYLSVFNGAFATQLISKIYHHTQQTIDSIAGFIYYGTWGAEKFSAIPDNVFELNNQISVEEVFNQINPLVLNFKDINGNPVMLEKDKPCILQFMGSWCPNCIDETKMFAKWQDTLKNKIQIIALCVERTNDEQKALELLKKIKIKYHILYPVILLSHKGTQGIQGFSELKKIPAFPTTVYLNKNHEPQYAFIGFSGPATGAEYDKTQKEILQIIQKLTH